MTRATFALIFLAPFVALILWDAAKTIGGGFIARRRRLALEAHVDAALALCDPSAPIFGRTSTYGWDGHNIYRCRCCESVTTTPGASWADPMPGWARHVAAAVLDSLGTGAGQAAQIVAALDKVDCTWGGAAMVVKDTVLSILGDRCTNEFCEHDHAAMRNLRAGAGQAAVDALDEVQRLADETWSGSAAPALDMVAQHYLDRLRQTIAQVRAAVTTADDATPSDQGGDNEAGEGVGG